MKICYGLESVCDFLIRTPVNVIFVKVRRTEKIISTIREFEHEYRDMIEELQLFPESTQILLELWIYSKNGTYRYFRVGRAGLSEIERDGTSGLPVSPGDS
ncbi:hypothetical protein [Methanoregula sp.]|uniref:hypothetical protein n=1 Tax=Methanoregula sp. TaxID=2052170 RepID=UPI002375EBF5|nr:hypothetical protein [Methanoregula sp.]MDD1685807.1 hypothetical protein [Methanoregula sp.]